MAPNQPPPNLSADTWPSSIFLLRKHHIAKNKNVSDGALTQPPPNLTANTILYNIFYWATNKEHNSKQSKLEIKTEPPPNLSMEKFSVFIVFIDWQIDNIEQTIKIDKKDNKKKNSILLKLEF